MSEAQTADRVLSLLAHGKLELQGLLPWGSNYTFLTIASDDALSLPAVYKPCAGERPLWDFDYATLCRREVATYLLSRQLGWPAVPPTVLRDGPHGPGSVQLFIQADPEQHFFTLRDSGNYRPQLQQMALFDVLINNADRKGGHCLLGGDGRIWSIDHGLCFHQEYKLRTVIWDFAGQAVPAGLLADLRRLEFELAPKSSLGTALLELLSQAELDALQQRAAQLVADARFPDPGPGRNIPYPLI